MSCFAQKRRSWSSFAKRGNGFLAARLALLIDPPFSSTHIPRRDDSDQSLSDRENHCEPARRVGLSQGRVPWLALRVFDVWRHQEWAVEEHLLALSLGNLVQVPVLVGVASVPLKTGALSQVIGKAGHKSMYMLNIYVCQAPDRFAARSPTRWRELRFRYEAYGAVVCRRTWAPNVDAETRRRS